MNVRRATAWAVFVIALFAVTVWLVLGDRATLVDEAWMLWVTKRVTSGDRLYSDVYYVSTPLAVWLSAAFVLVGGVQLWVLRVLEVSVFVAEFLVAISIARWCRVSRATLVLFGAAVFAVGAPATEWISVYSSVAVMFALVALRMLLVWLDHRDGPDHARARAWALAAVGAACGLSFASKPNIGLLALAAAVASIWLTRRRGRAAAPDSIMRAFMVVGGVFAAVLVLMVIPVLATGSWSAFVSQVFADKGDYVRVGSSYFTIVHTQLDVFVTAVTDGERALTILHAGVVMLPIVIVAIAAWAIARARREARPRVTLFAIFAAAALLSMFPRPGSNHLAGVSPLAFSATLGAIVMSTRDRPVARRLQPVAWGVIAATVLAALVVIAVHSVAGHDDPLVARSGFAHFDGIAVPERFQTGVADIRHFVRTHTDGKVFILREDAGFWYLTTGTENPLPFDIPEISDFGADGQRGVIKRLERGEATWVCVKPADEKANGVLEPRHIRHWVRSHFEFVETIRQCDMYHKPA
jgi:4-amino-4-deoxy-L-arabinose transferase-like glycosyltransferase